MSSLPKDILLKEAATRLRINCIKSTCASNSGHPTSCSSIAEIMAVLFLDEMKYFPHDPKHPANDRFVLSKGHAAPILYAAWTEVGLIPEEHLLTLRRIDSDLEGHPTPRASFVDVATGSLGQGLSIAAGMAYTGKYLDKASYRVYTIIGDGESAEGSIWEAMSFASHYNLDNLVAIFDVNRLGQSQPTSLQHNFDTYKNRCEAFGWHAVTVNGHDVSEIIDALSNAHQIKGRPTAIIAKTYKGFDFLSISDSPDWHGKPLGGKTQEVLIHLESQLTIPSTFGVLKPSLPKNDCHPVKLIGNIQLPGPPQYNIGDKVATRLAYGDVLCRIGKANDRVIGLDGDTKNSTYSIKLMDACPNQFIECFIAEQNLVGVAIGCAVRERTIPFVSTFGAFLTRAFDQIRMGTISRTNCNFVGSHAGVSIGEDGPSQMALEDLAIFRTIQGSTVFYPSDAVATENAVLLACNTPGICFIRTGRPALPVVYKNEEQFTVGKGKIVRGGSTDHVTVVAAGVTLFEAFSAADELAKEGISIRLIDPFTIKPIDTELLTQAAKDTHGRFVVVEDHFPEGGIGEAVMSCLSKSKIPHRVIHLAVNSIPRSGKPEELLAFHGLDAASITKAVKSILTP